MAQKLLARTCLLVALGQFAGASSQRLEDTAALVQTVARVKDEIADESVDESTDESADESAEGRPHIRPLRELLTEAGHKWAEKSEVAGKKWFERQEERMAHVDQRIREKIQSLSEPPTEAPPAQEPQSSQEEFATLSEEAKTAKYGIPITLIVTDPLERRLNVKFRQHTKLHALFNSLCKRSRLHLDTVSFMSGSRLLRGNETAASAGLVDGDIIELRSDVLQHKQEKKLLEEKAAARRARVLAEKEEAARQDMLRKNAAREKLLADYYAQKANRTQVNKTNVTKVKTLSKGDKKELRRRKRKEMVKAGHMVDLTFVYGKGKEVAMAFKRDLAFGPLQTLVCKRLGLKEAETGFFWDNELTDVRIRKNETVSSLRLPNHAVIKVLPLVPPVQ
mmetsp:Transcript_37381/g.86889  ORF Transcript_37381/g.86889 Transcript_37381/m.86889 type:complete len:393 (+) Transcript_37381:47-1225(+)